MDIAIGGTDEFGANGKRMVKLGLRVDLNQRIKRNGRGTFDNLGKLFTEQARRQDHRIRAGQACFEDLIDINNNVLREHGNLDCVMNGGKIGIGALERAAIDSNGQASRPNRFEILGQRLIRNDFSK